MSGGKNTKNSENGQSRKVMKKIFRPVSAGGSLARRRRKNVGVGGANKMLISFARVYDV